MAAIILVSRGYIATAGLFFLLCLLLDFADGLAAKMLNATSEFGKQLDSLADVISFGAFPAMAMFITFERVWMPFNMLENMMSIYLFIVVIIPAAGALRLAAFNLDREAVSHFKGLPIPAAAIGFVSLAYITLQMCPCNPVYQYFNTPFWGLASIIVFSLLMVTKIPMLSFKFNNLRWKENRVRIIFVALVIAGFVYFKLMMLPFLIPFYIIYSLIFIRKKKPVA
jgi:CDP-diacylglycerol--serine O-phosphatidyltransferase